MLTLDTLLSTVERRPDPHVLLRDFVPPSRFAEKSFGSYEPRHPSQELARTRVREIAGSLHTESQRKRASLLYLRRRPEGVRRGVYLDGGFGVGKTHLLAALWNAGPAPRAYLSFDELMYFIGLLGPTASAEAFRGHRLIAVDEWELDDPGNLKLALSFLRGAFRNGAFVAVTSNTLPIDLGAGRFSQKDFRAEVDELASAFEVVRVEGEDYRHRHFTTSPGRRIFTPPDAVELRLETASPRTLRTSLPALVGRIATVHPIHYRDLSRRIDLLVLDRLEPLPSLADALRLVHFVDSLYVTGAGLMAVDGVGLDELFTGEALEGPFAKKLLRCLSRMEEMLGAGVKRVQPVAEG